jgi:hypothetical protein
MEHQRTREHDRSLRRLRQHRWTKSHAPANATHGTWFYEPLQLQFRCGKLCLLCAGRGALDDAQSYVPCNQLFAALFRQLGEPEPGGDAVGAQPEAWKLCDLRRHHNAVIRTDSNLRRAIVLGRS